LVTGSFVANLFLFLVAGAVLALQVIVVHFLPTSFDLRVIELLMVGGMVLLMSYGLHRGSNLRADLAHSHPCASDHRLKLALRRQLLHVALRLEVVKVSLLVLLLLVHLFYSWDLLLPLGL
jgi:hypothetical protein